MKCENCQIVDVFEPEWIQVVEPCLEHANAPETKRQRDALLASTREMFAYHKIERHGYRGESPGCFICTNAEAAIELAGPKEQVTG